MLTLVDHASGMPVATRACQEKGGESCALRALPEEVPLAGVTLQPQPEDGQPAGHMAPNAAVGRAEHNGRQHPPRHGLLPPTWASEPYLPARHAPTRRPPEGQQDEMTRRSRFSN